MEAYLTPASHSDVRLLQSLLWDLPEGRCFWAIGLTRTTAWKMSSIRLLPLRKKQSKRAIAVYVAFVQQRLRRRIERVGSRFGRLLPRWIHVRAARGFELKIMLFLLAYTVPYSRSQLA